MAIVRSLVRSDQGQDKLGAGTKRLFWLPLPSRAQEITFRSLVEEFAASHNLLFLPAGKVHEKSRLPLFRVAKSVEGRGGLLVYLLDEAVWAASPEGADDDYRAITLEDMVIRATKGK